mmetsp:Transcript_11360/g.31718  ORF Transcript_11360/g.31718 Transcript_11360/m.31718 type:complete len:216 (+) Transcript_11360:1173-1820(+)
MPVTPRQRKSAEVGLRRLGAQTRAPLGNPPFLLASTATQRHTLVQCQQSIRTIGSCHSHAHHQHCRRHASCRCPCHNYHTRSRSPALRHTRFHVAFRSLRNQPCLHRCGQTLTNMVPIHRLRHSILHIRLHLCHHLHSRLHLRTHHLHRHILRQIPLRIRLGTVQTVHSHLRCTATGGRCTQRGCRKRTAQSAPCSHDHGRTFYTRPMQTLGKRE